MDKKKDVLMDHDYDGIKELDNDLPPWWLWLFYITIIFSVVYMLHYHVLGTGDSSAVEYEKEMNPNWKPVEQKEAGISFGYHSPYYNPKGDITPLLIQAFDQYIGPDVPNDVLIMEAMRRSSDADRKKLIAAFPELWKQVSEGGAVAAVVEEKVPAAAAEPVKPAKTYTAITDNAGLASGKNIYTTNCVACHGTLGEGGIGPNFTDDYWIHGAGMSNMVHTITVGVPAKGMISWRGILSEEQMVQVASYILTLPGADYFRNTSLLL